MNRVCKICNISFSCASSCKRHCKSKHVRELLGKNSIILDQKFECHTCGKCFNRKDSLRRHIILLHTDLYSSEDCITCDDCKKSFRVKRYLERHVKIHLNAKIKAKKACEICNINFTCASSYKRHYTSKHIQEQLGKNYIKSRKFECHTCEKCFNRKDSLRRHIISLHTDLYSYEDCFTCHNCKKSYRFERYLKRHMRKKHMNAETKIIKKCRCPLCYEAFVNEATILDHFKVTHNVPIEKQHLRFNSKSEFDDWKKDMQISMHCSYIYQSHYDGRGTGKQTWRWQCHRNGNFTPVALRKRRPSKKGSKKLNTFCPSMIKLVIKPDNYNNLTCYVDFIPIHIGHSTDKNELVHVRFDSSIRDEIAAKLEAEIPISKILKDIRHTGGCSLSNELYYKEQLITKKDIRNVGYLRNISNNILNPRKCPNDVNQVEDYVFDPENKDSILFFKNHGENHYDFKKDDFVIIIMKIKQMEKLIKYGSNIVCLDGSHCTNLYDYTLHTLLVVDEYEEGHPCCYMISNKNNDIACQYMFSAIKEKIGMLRPVCFISDVQEIYINAWRKVMEYEPKFVLWCTWHVKNAWRKHYCQIKPTEKREALKAQLNDLLDEPDKTKFHEKLSTFLCTTDQDCKKFMDYFISEYVSKYQLWANAYRQHADINTNIRIELFRKLLKYKYMKGVKFGQLQNLLHTLDDIQDKNEDDLICDIKGKLTLTERLLRKAHNEALKYEFVENLIHQKGEKEYIVKSLSNDLQEYTILKIDCNILNCMIKCEDCKVCIHEFKCTCRENSIRNNMCKHIHLLCLQRSEELSSQFVPIIIKNQVQFKNESDVYVENQEDVNIQSYQVSSPVPAEIKTDKLTEQFSDILKKVSTKKDEIYLKQMLHRINLLWPIP